MPAGLSYGQTDTKTIDGRNKETGNVADGIRLTEINDTNADAFMPFVPESMKQLYGKPTCLFIGVVDGHLRASGILVASHVGHWEILWVYVAEQCRRRGMASTLLRGLSEHYLNAGKEVIQAFITGVMDFPSLLALFRKNGYSIEEEGGLAYFETELERVKFEGFGMRKSRFVVPFRELTLEQLRVLSKRTEAWKGMRRIPLPILLADYDPCSHVGMDGGNAVGACLVTKNGRGLEFRFMRMDKGRNEMLLEILLATIKAMKSSYPRTVRIGALALSGTSGRLCRKLSEGVDEYAAYRAVYGRGDFDVPA